MLLGLLWEKSTTIKYVLFQVSAKDFVLCAKMVNQSFMRICDFLNRAGGVKGWQDLRENDSKRYELEEEYKAQKNRPDLFKVTVLATGKLVDSQVVTQNELPKDYSEEKLRADIFAWSGSRPPKVVYMYDPSSGREEMNVVLTNLKYAESDRAAEEKLEKERPRDVTTVDRAESALKNSMKRARPVKKTLYVREAPLKIAPPLFGHCP